MTAMAPVQVYGLTVPAGSIAVEADGGVDYPATFRITMAAIDPTAEVDPEDPKLAVLKLIKVPAPDFGDDEDEDDDMDSDEDDVSGIERRLGLVNGDDEDEDEDEDDSDDEAGAGPSNPAMAKARAQAAILKALEDDEDEDMDDSLMSNGTKKNKGKARALDAMAAFEDADEDDEDLDDEEDEIKEYIICTLDPTKACQQALDITLNNENELCYFQVSGGYDVHLTGNFVIPPIEDDDEDDDEYDEEDPLGLDGLEEDSEEIDSEEDELDDIDDPRIMEVDSDEEEAPALVKAAVAKGKNKRGAEDAGLDVLDKIIASETTIDKLSKKDKKKLKNNAGEPVATAAASPATADKKAKAVPKDAVAQAAAAEKDTPTNGKKSVQFAKNLEQGPTPSKGDGKTGGALGVKIVEGVTIDDKKLGTGKQVKKGNRVELRYIGKLTNGKQFDANKKGKPFSFKVGAGEVVKGFDIGVQGMQVGGERRITIPAKLGYGSKSPGKEIPANSDLVFDLKLLGVN